MNRSITLPDPNILPELIESASALALVIAAKREKIVSSEKTPGQFVSEADLTIERHLRSRIAQVGGFTQIAGEEGGGSVDDLFSGWVLDPIDGTTNFIRGLPFWAISIAYLNDGIPTLGAIALPELGIILTCSRGRGVRLNGAEFSSRRRNLNPKIFALGENDFEAPKNVEARAMKLRSDGYSVVRYGSAVFSLAQAALGHLDGYIENGCHVWDVSAASVICSELGMEVIVQRLNEHRYSIDAHW